MAKNQERMKARFGLDRNQPVQAPYGPRGRYVTPTWAVWVDGKACGTAVKLQSSGWWDWKPEGASNGIATPAKNREELRLWIAQEHRVHPKKVALWRA